MTNSSKTRTSRLQIGGRWWKIIYGQVPQGRGSKRRNVGYCDYTTRTITVSNRLGPGSQLATLMHEVLHATLPNASEKQVLAAEKALCGAINGWVAHR